MTASTNSKRVHRLASISPAAPDAILGLNEAYAADPNPAKMNLSVGVYKDASGKTPILKCVKEAERRLIESEPTKGYLGIDGLPDYRNHVCALVFGESVVHDRIATVQTPGGTGALRVSADFLANQLNPIKIWMSNPTWANHAAVFGAAGVPTDTYRYLNADRTSLDFDAMIEDLGSKASAGDAVLLHACCHNPTGIDPTAEQWNQIASVVRERNLFPIIDFAYQGFGAGIDEDAIGVRTVLSAVDEAIVCNSFSKNFGLYSERVGAVSIVGADADTATAALSQLKKVVRSNYSNPPRHGAAIVAAVLDDSQLTEMWKLELKEMRERITRLRELFVETMKSTGSGYDFDFLLPQNGMFSFSGLSRMQVDELRSKHSIYIVGSGRINVAGMSEAKMPKLCEAVASVL